VSPVLQVDLSDPSDVRTSLNILNLCLGIVPRGAQNTPSADSQQPLTPAMAVLRQKKVWPFLEQVADLEVSEYSLPELATYLDMPSNRVGSLRAILAKLEQRLELQFFELAPSRATDTQGNPRYRMPDAIKKAIRAQRKKLPEMNRIAKQILRDMIDHSELFAGLNSSERRECFRMSSGAIDLLWDRTGAAHSDCVGETQSEHIDFLKHHPRLIECVKHLFEQDKEREISKLRLHTGQCAAMMYLMASSASDIDAYRNSNPPSEKQLSWQNWDKAEEFWTLIAARNKRLVPVYDALRALVDENAGGGSRRIEKLAVVAKAWRLFRDQEKITKKALALKYEEDVNGIRRLVEQPSVGGIDLGKSADETARAG
jgi:hypothetical protein